MEVSCRVREHKSSHTSTWSLLLTLKKWVHDSIILGNDPIFYVRFLGSPFAAVRARSPQMSNPDFLTAPRQRSEGSQVHGDQPN